MTKATDLKPIFLKSTRKSDVETTGHTLIFVFKQKNIFTFFTFFWHFFQPSLAKVIDLTFFSMSWP